MEVRWYTKIMWRRKWVVVLATFMAVAVAALGSYLMTPVYFASTTVRIAQMQDDWIDYEDLNYSVRLMNTYARLLRSGPFLEEVIQRLDLNISPDELAKSIRVEALSETELLRITAESPDPSKAMKIANMLGTLLIEQGQKVYSGEGKTAQEMLQEQLTIVEQNLAEDRALLQSLLNDNASEHQSVRIQDLNTRIRSQEETYAMLVHEYNKAQVGEEMRANSISVVEPAITPKAPSKPRMKMNIMLGGLVGLFGGIGLALLFENLDPTPHSRRESEAVAPVVGDLRAQLSEREGELEALRAEMMERESTIGEQLAEWGVAVQGLEAQLREKEGEVEALRAQMMERESTIGEQLAKRGAAVLGLKAQLREKEGELETLGAEMMERESIIDSFQAQVAEGEAVVGNLRAQLREKEGEVEALRAEMMERESIIDSFQVQVAEGEAVVGNLRAQLREKEGEVEALRAEMMERESIIDSFQAQLAEWGAAVQGLEAQLREKEGEVEALRGQMMERESTIDSFQAQLAKREALVGDLKAQLREKEGEFEALRGQMMQRESIIDSFQVQVAEGEALVGDLRAQLREKEGEFEALRAQIVERENTIDRFREQLAKWGAAVQGLNAQLSEKEGEVEVLRAKMMERESTFQAQLAEGEAVVGDLKAQLSEKEGEVEALRAQMVESESIIDSFQAQVAERETVVGDLKAQLSESEGELEVLRAQMMERESTIDSFQVELAEREAAVQGLKAQLRRGRRWVTVLDLDVRSSAGDAYQILRTSFLSLSSPKKMLLITSVEPGVGKSRLLANLAAAMAEAGQRVVVADGNFRRPSIHHVFDLSNELGLSDVILGRSRVDTALQETEIQGLRVLTSGPLPPNPAELLGSARMQELVWELATVADMVLLDSPPVLDAADAAVLAPIVDGVLLVAAGDEATGARIQRALEEIDKVGAKALGLVVDRARTRRGEYYPRYRYVTASAESVPEFGLK